MQGKRVDLWVIGHSEFISESTKNGLRTKSGVTEVKFIDGNFKF